MPGLPLEARGWFQRGPCLTLHRSEAREGVTNVSYLDQERGYRGDDGPRNADYWAGHNQRLKDIDADNKRLNDLAFPPSSGGSSSSAGNSHASGPPKTIGEMAKAGAALFGVLFAVYAFLVYGQPGITGPKLVGQAIVAVGAGLLAGVALWIAIRVLKIALIVGAWGLLLAFVYYAFGAR